MKLYEFEEPIFPVYAVIYANNEAEAYRYYESNIAELKSNYNVPKALDIDEFWDTISKRYTYLDKFGLNDKFNHYCEVMLSKKTIKRII